MIKNLVFDLAGVILNLDLEEDTRALLEIGLPPFDECLRRPEICIPVMKYINGLSNEDELYNKVKKQCNPSVSKQDIIKAMDAVLSDIPASRLALLKELRTHYKIYLLSNIYEKAWNYALDQMAKAGYSLEQCFDNVFLSYELQLAKPDPRIFEVVIKATGIQPEETIYLDDTSENVEAGAKMGFKSYKVPMNQLEKVLTQLSII